MTTKLPAKHLGLIVPMSTPFAANGAFTELAAARLVARFAEHRPGVFLMGTSRERASVQVAHCKRLVELTTPGSGRSRLLRPLPRLDRAGRGAIRQGADARRH